MPKHPDNAEIIPFDQVRRIVQERRRLRPAEAAEDLETATPLTNARISQVRRILSNKRAAERPPTGPGAAA